MALPKINQARELSDEELADEIVAAKRKLFELRLQKATGRLEKTHQFKHTRHWIAQLMTVERERQLQAQAGAHNAEPHVQSEQEIQE
ncbi:MAG: 50S ribosomal protein L29 [Cyanophyceae cyanobacterium]